MENKYKQLADKYKVSARTYTNVLGLAIFQTTGNPYSREPMEVANAEKTPETWKLACDILELLASKEHINNPTWEVL